MYLRDDSLDLEHHERSWQRFTVCRTQLSGDLGTRLLYR
eukprot:SAG25_NODE_14698_length_252_cov_0.633987_1_plen_38_part_10